MGTRIWVFLKCKMVCVEWDGVLQVKMRWDWVWRRRRRWWRRKGRECVRVSKCPLQLFRGRDLCDPVSPRGQRSCFTPADLIPSLPLPGTLADSVPSCCLQCLSPPPIHLCLSIYICYVFYLIFSFNLFPSQIYLVLHYFYFPPYISRYSFRLSRSLSTYLNNINLTKEFITAGLQLFFHIIHQPVNITSMHYFNIVHSCFFFPLHQWIINLQ